MMNILIIFTGGTLGSCVNDCIIDTDMSCSAAIIDIYTKTFGNDCNFNILKPFAELSENFTVDTINLLADTLENIDFKEYDGVIIAHGSDTAAYSCAFISFMFSSVKCPVVFIASDYPPENPCSNALKNLRSAVQFIKSKTVKKGVFFSYGNHNQNACIYIGTRINEADCFNDRFSAFGNEVFGTVSDDRFIYNNNPFNPAPEVIDNNYPQIKHCRLVPDSSVILKSFTGMNYDLINIDNPSLKSVVNIMYHSASACTSGINTSFAGFIEKCRKRNIDVYCVSFKNTEDIYSSVKIIKDCGGIPLYNISYEAAYAKSVIANSINDKSIMNKNIFFEHIQDLRSDF